MLSATSDKKLVGAIKYCERVADSIKGPDANVDKHECYERLFC